MKKVRKIEVPEKDNVKILRVAAYCRVSTKYESQMDAMVFLIYGGQAIVREDICEKYLPEFVQDFIGS